MRSPSTSCPYGFMILGVGEATYIDVQLRFVVGISDDPIVVNILKFFTIRHPYRYEEHTIGFCFILGSRFRNSVRGLVEHVESKMAIIQGS